MGWKAQKPHQVLEASEHCHGGEILVGQEGRFLGCRDLFSARVTDALKSDSNNDLFENWQPVGESNPSFQVENLAS